MKTIMVSWYRDTIRQLLARVNMNEFRHCGSFRSCVNLFYLCVYYIAGCFRTSACKTSNVDSIRNGGLECGRKQSGDNLMQYVATFFWRE